MLCVVWSAAVAAASSTHCCCIVNPLLLPKPATALIIQKLLPPGTVEPPNLDLTILMDVPNSSSKSGVPGLRPKSPDAELAALVSAIQATNSKAREVDTLMEDANHNIAHLQVS